MLQGVKEIWNHIKENKGGEGHESGLRFSLGRNKMNLERERLEGGFN